MQLHRLRLRRSLTRSAPLVEAYALLGALFQLQQDHHHGQQHRGQLRGGDAVVHRQPSLVDTGRESLDAKVAGHAKVSQRFHEGQRHTGCHGGAGQRQGDFEDAP